MLAMILALLGTIVLANWHDAQPHIHGADGAQHSLLASDHHDEDRHDDESTPSSDPVHMAAHMVIQGIAIPAAPMLAATSPARSVEWSVWRPESSTSIPGDSILRPPRA